MKSPQKEDRFYTTPDFEFNPQKSGMKAREFDRKFDRGEDLTEHLDLSKARRPEEDPRRVNVDFPTWMIDSLDREAKRLGVTRQSIIKVWIAERLEKRVA